jgi:hypothetical protein
MMAEVGRRFQPDVAGPLGRPLVVLLQEDGTDEAGHRGLPLVTATWIGTPEPRFSHARFRKD